MLDRENERKEQISCDMYNAFIGKAFATASLIMTALASEEVRDHQLQEGNRPVVVENISIQHT